MFNFENMRIEDTAVFVVYLLFMLSIGVYFFFKNKNAGEKGYFLGGRKMGAWVTALSAGASDMSAWVLMGLPAAVYAFGLGQVWIPVGLAIGYTISWLVEAPRLRRFSIVANDSITIPQYLTNRFLSKSRALQLLCAVVFLIAYTVYAASSIKACGTLFNTVMGIDATTAMYLAAVIIIGYTFLGGFSAVCWTDFFQGMLMLGAMFLAPLFASFMLDFSSNDVIPGEYWNAFANWKDIVSGLAWGLGYFGMPHIIIRFMSLESQKSLKKSAKIGITWTVLIVIFAALIGIIGRMKLGLNDAIAGDELVFIVMVRKIFPGIIAGIVLSAVLAASMSTADSQLLSAASSFASDVYKPIFRKNQAGDKEMLWAGRVVVLLISVVAVLIASNPGAGNIMSLVSNAWGVFGAAFGPVIMLTLFWKRFNFQGAIAGILVGTIVDIGWLIMVSAPGWFPASFATLIEGMTGIYELLPGFVAGTIASVVVALVTNAPGKDVEELFDAAVNYQE